MCVHQKTCTRIFRISTFVIAKNWKQSEHTSTVEWINKCVVYSYSGMLYRNENDKTAAIFDNRIVVTFGEESRTMLGEEINGTVGVLV